jgi:predicted MFS family arabinose efflux permease
MKPNAKLFTFFSLYLAQAVPMSLFSTLLPVLLRQEAFSLSAIGLLQFIKLPWIFKFLWAPAVDAGTSSLKGFKRWIVGSELVYALLLAGIAFLHLEIHFTVIFVAMILSFIASATQDIATDALNALSFNRTERGRGNSMQSMGSFAGTLLGAGVLMMLYHRVGWTVLFLGVAAFLLLALLPLLRYRGTDLVFAKTPTRPGFGDLISFFKQKGAAGRVLFLILIQSSFIGLLAMYKPFLVDHGFKLPQIGLMFGVFGPLFGILSSFAGGFLLRRTSRHRMKVVVGIMGLLTPICFLLLTSSSPQPALLYGFVALIWTTYGLASVLINTVAMDFVRPGREGTDFTLQTVLVQLSSMLVAVASGAVADRLGYGGLGWCEIGMALLAFLGLMGRSIPTHHARTTRS